jgi:hypothetical protein
MGTFIIELLLMDYAILQLAKMHIRKVNLCLFTHRIYRKKDEKQKKNYCKNTWKEGVR